MSYMAAAIGISAVGAGISAYTNKQAANKASDATIQGAQINAQALRDAQVKQEALSREGIASNEAYGKEAVGRFDTIAGESAPAGTYLRNVMGNPGDLTPQQAQALIDLRRASGNQINTSSIAGSGRTAASLLRRVESDFTNTALAQNRARADDAAGRLYDTGSRASFGAAGTTADIGKTNANVLGHVGDVQASLTAKEGDVMNRGTQQAGLYQAAGDLATGKVAGTALGDIGSAIRAEGRASSYADRMSAIENSLGIGRASGSPGGLPSQA